jgi:hypothetical protein
MFGLFGKKEAPNGTFNNIVISVLADFSRVSDRRPSQDELIATVSNLATKVGFKLTAQQVSAIQLCSAMLPMSAGDEIFALARQVSAEIPLGRTDSADALQALLCNYGVLSSDEAIEFMRAHLKNFK